MNALSLVVQQLGLGACPHCITRAQQVCPDPWFHMATATCGACESMFDYRGEHAGECPAVAIARLSATCKATGAMRDPAQVQVHVQTRKARLDQFKNLEDPSFEEMQYSEALSDDAFW